VTSTVKEICINLATKNVLTIMFKKEQIQKIINLQP
jgi:hypothetical protein